MPEFGTTLAIKKRVLWPATTWPVLALLWAHVLWLTLSIWSLRMAADTTGNLQLQWWSCGLRCKTKRSISVTVTHLVPDKEVETGRNHLIRRSSNPFIFIWKVTSRILPRRPRPPTSSWQSKGQNLPVGGVRCFFGCCELSYLHYQLKNGSNFPFKILLSKI